MSVSWASAACGRIRQAFRWVRGPGREGPAIVVVVALLTSLNSTTKFLVTLPLQDWFGEFLGDFAEGLVIGVAGLASAIWARKAVPTHRFKQYVAMAVVVAVAMIVAVVCVETWLAGGRLIAPGDSWEDLLIFLMNPIIHYASVGMIIACSWLYLCAEADHATALASVAMDSERMDRQSAEAQLQVLEAQIEPHFLFNTLATVKRLYETEPAAGATMMRNLKEYLAIALPQMRTAACTLGRESDHAAAYLRIQKVRMGRRLAYAFDIPPALRSVQIPPLMLLTLVENAIKHGLTPQPDGGRIDVKARVVDGQLRVSVADTGQGFTRWHGHGTGLANTRARLESYFGEKARLSLAINVPRGVVAMLTLPYEKSVNARGTR